MADYSNIFPTNRSIPANESCGWFLYGTIHEKVRICDIFLLIPNTIFLVFLCCKMVSAHSRLAAVPSPIVKTIFAMVVLVSTISIARCCASISLTWYFVASKGEAIPLKVMWLILRCFLLAVELSIIIFGLCAGHLDSRRSVRRVIGTTSLCSTVFILLQAALEISPARYQHWLHHGIYDKDYKIFTHGGMVFWFTSSTFFGLVYLIITMVPCTRLPERYLLPKKRAFYMYCGFLAVVNFTQSVGSAMCYYQEPFGLCIVDCTIIFFYALFAPLVYWTFLAGFFCRRSGYTVLSINYAGSSAAYQTFSDTSIDNGPDHLPRRNMLA